MILVSKRLNKMNDNKRQKISEGNNPNMFLQEVQKAQSSEDIPEISHLPIHMQILLYLHVFMDSNAVSMMNYKVFQALCLRMQNALLNENVDAGAFIKHGQLQQIFKNVMQNPDALVLTFYLEMIWRLDGAGLFSPRDASWTYAGEQILKWKYGEDPIEIRGRDLRNPNDLVLVSAVINFWRIRFRERRGVLLDSVDTHTTVALAIRELLSTNFSSKSSSSNDK